MSGQLQTPVNLLLGKEWPWYPLDRVVGMPKNQSGWHAEETNIAPTRTWTLLPVAWAIPVPVHSYARMESNAWVLFFLELMLKMWMHGLCNKIWHFWLIWPWLHTPSHFQVFWAPLGDARNLAGPADSSPQLRSVSLPVGPCGEISTQFLSVPSDILVLAEKKKPYITSFVLTIKTMIKIKCQVLPVPNYLRTKPRRHGIALSLVTLAVVIFTPSHFTHG
jgi:hypothetical protein